MGFFRDLVGLPPKPQITAQLAPPVVTDPFTYYSQFTPFQSVSRDEAMSVPAVMRCRNLIATTIGVDAATIKSRLQAGETLAAIAGAKKDALIAALVAQGSKEIDARVTAGTLTAAQATSIKADLTNRITTMVNSAPGKGFGPKNGMGKGPRH